MAALAALLSEAAAAVQRCDGVALAALLSHDSARPAAAVAEALRTQPSLDVAALASQRLPAPYDEARAPPPQRRPAALRRATAPHVERPQPWSRDSALSSRVLPRRCSPTTASAWRRWRRTSRWTRACPLPARLPLLGAARH